MVSQAAVQAKVNYGLGKAALALGATCGWYRPTGAFTPMSLIGTVLAYFRPPSGAFTTPSGYGKATFIGTFDPTLIEVGDYLVEPTDGAFFVASTDPIAQPLCVQCNRTVNVLRPASNAGIGAQPYGGDIAPSETPIMSGWGASMLTKSRGEGGATNLPGDVRSPWFEVLLPAWPGVAIEYDDVLTDDQGRRCKIGTAELTGLGWRLMVIQSGT